MSKYVYLFELDSVRKTDAEIVIGQEALYDEIVSNGNIVVLTYNQLVDSRAFFSLLEDPDYYNNLIALFERGAIRISQYGDVRTIVQYLINSFAYDRRFIYSGWPLKSDQKRLLALIKRSLMYSDLTELNDYLNGVRSISEIQDLFINVDGNQQISNTDLNPEQCEKILEKLFWLIKTILRLSSIHTIYVNPKPDDKYKMTLPKYIHHALSLNPPSDSELWNEAIEIIKSLDKVYYKDLYKGVPEKEEPIFVFNNIGESSTDRSDYHHAIKYLYSEALKDHKSPRKLSYQYAEAIVDICYNYQLEYSICNVSKHYNLDEFSFNNPNEWITFSADFFSRLDQVWNLENYDNRYLLEETNEFKEFQAKWKWLDKLLKFKKVPNKIPDFKKAVRLTEYTSKKKDEKSSEGVQRYEHNIKSQKIKRRFKIKFKIMLNILFTIVCILIACLMEFGIQKLQDCLDTTAKWNCIRKILEYPFVEIFLFLCIAEIIAQVISIFCPWFMSLSEAIIKLKRLVADCFTISFHRAKTYLNNCRKNVDEVEPYRKGEHIDFVRSDAMKQYISMMNKGPSPLFGESEVYPIADIGNNSPNKNKILENEILKDLSRLEEIYGYHFGVVYKSKFNTMVVDPILTKCPISTSCNKKPYFPYERIVPSSGNDGVVMIAKYKDKFLLLKQFRHAIRREQYSFPRGFAEPNSTPQENAKRELQEEICAVIKKDPILLGRIAPDSGLTSCRAYVFLVEIDDYKKASLAHEGIKEIVEVTKPKLENMIKLRKIDDGFTLGAYALYKIFKKNECKHKFCDFFKSL